MQRFLPLFLALLVVGGGAFPLVAATQTDDIEQSDRVPVAGVSPDTPRVLELEQQEAAAFGRPDLSVTTALEADRGALESVLFQYDVETRYERAETEDAKQAVLLDAIARIADRVDQVSSEERTARISYIQGDDTASTYLDTIGRVDKEAQSLSRALDHIERLSERGSTVRSEANTVRSELETLTGPIREDVGAIVLGEQPSARIFVGSAAQGTVLSTIDDGVYVREAVRTDNRDDAVGSMTIEGAQTRFTELYPVAWEKRSSIGIDPRGPDTWRLELRHDHGSMTSYLDTSTGFVYRDIHVKTLSGIPTVVESTVRANNTTLNVSRTYAGGPLKVAVTNATGSPSRADVWVNGTRMGPTGPDGVIWTISPPGTYNVTAERDGNELVASVTAR